jgi:hypothetical protein
MKTMRRSGFLATAALLVVLSQWPATARAQSGGGNGPYAPPACVAGVPFADVTCTTFYDAWIEQFARDGITSGCGSGNYCPNENVTRAQMAVFIEAAMRGTANWQAHTQLAWAVKASNGAPDPSASGQALLTAVAAIPTSGNDAPSATNPWLLKIGPGIFDLGSSPLQIPAYVSLEGSGTGSTTIQSTGFGSPGSATVVGAGGASVSDLSIVNTGGAAYATGYLVSGSSPRVQRVSITVTPGSTDSYGIYLAGGASPTFEDISINLYNSGSGAFYGVFTDSGSNPTFEHATVTLGADGSGSGAAFEVQGSITGRRLNVSTGFYGNTSGVISGVVATGSVALSDSDIAAGCAGSGPVYAVSGSSSVNLNNVRAYVWLLGGGSCTAYAAYLNNASALIRGSQLTGYNYGLYATGATSAQSIHVDSSVLEGFGKYIVNGSNYTTVIGATRITDGYGHTNSGSLTCAGLYGEGGTFFPTTCP